MVFQPGRGQINAFPRHLPCWTTGKKTEGKWCGCTLNCLREVSHFIPHNNWLLIPKQTHTHTHVLGGKPQNQAKREWMQGHDCWHDCFTAKKQTQCVDMARWKLSARGCCSFSSPTRQKLTLILPLARSRCSGLPSVKMGAPYTSCCPYTPTPFLVREWGSHFKALINFRHANPISVLRIISYS